MKQCRKCKQEKSFNEFSKAKRNKDGLHSYCKQCERIRGRSYYYLKEGKSVPPERISTPEGFKQCPKCEMIKPSIEFNKHNKRRDGLRSHCKVCDKTFVHQWKANGGAEKMASWSKKRRYENMVRLIEYLLQHPCVDCGNRNILVLEFDHVNGKNYDVTKLINREWNTILKEIALCEVRCANCHKCKTAERKMSLRFKCLQDLGLTNKIARWQFPQKVQP